MYDLQELTTEASHDWITGDWTDDAPVRWCRKLAYAIRDHHNDDAVTTSQLRKIFDELKKIKGLDPKVDKGKRKLRMIKPQLAYQVGRARRGKEAGIKALYLSFAKIMGPDPGNLGIDEFGRLVSLFEAVVAYHKASEVLGGILPDEFPSITLQA